MYSKSDIINLIIILLILQLVHMSLVCSVDNNKCPAALIAISTVSCSISPTKITLGLVLRKL